MKMYNIKLYLYTHLLIFFLKQRKFKMVNILLEKKKELAIKIRKNNSQKRLIC